MNRRMILYMPLQILKFEALLLLLPLLVTLIYREDCAFSFLITSAVTLAVTVPLTIILKPKNGVIYAREGFVIVALSWLFMSLLGAVPFVLSGAIESYVDAFFETVSGFTTTGASILDNVEALPLGLLFWRSFTHWLGGMGVLVFVMALINTSDRPIHLMRAEMPGPIVGKLVPKAKNNAKILYIIYFALTVIQIVFLVAGKMPFIEAVIHAFGTAGTGGFGIRSTSIAEYSPYIQWVITIFMFLFGINFNLYYLILVRRFKAAVSGSEFWVYLGLFLVSTGIITMNIRNLYGSMGETVRQAAFQVSSIITTTGYTTADFGQWPVLSQTVLLLLMLCGACAGSTAGGLKVSRVIILVKTIRRELGKTLHPRTVKTLRFEGKRLDEATISNTTSYLALYSVCITAFFLLLSFDKFDITTNLSATFACFNNIGPGLGQVGPALSYSGYSDFSKLLLSAAMLLGRLEIFPLFLALAPGTWIKK